MDWRLKRKETERETFFVRMPESRKGGPWGRPFSFPARRWAVGGGRWAVVADGWRPPAFPSAPFSFYRAIAHRPSPTADPPFSLLTPP